MKSKFIKLFTLEYNKNDKEKLVYGLDIIYTSFTKLLFLIIISIFINSLKLTILSILFISFIRSFSYGLHMESSIKCYIFSLVTFVLLPIFFLKININASQSIYLFILCIFSFLLFSPSDTYKRPLINRKKVKNLKYISIIVLFLYFFLYLIIKDISIKGLILYSIIIQSILINPITYKIFKLPCENFKEVMT